jgi:hypothetical protein
MKHFRTYEGYRLGVNGVGSLRNSLAALKRQNINGRYVDPETLAQGIRNEYEAITGEKYEDEIQMSMDNTIADIIGHFKLDGPDFMAAWDKVVKESVNEQYTKSLGFNVTNDNIYKLTKSLDPNGRLCKNISKGSDNVKPEFTEMQKLMEEIQRIWGEVEYIISMSNESVNDAYNNLEKIFGTDQESMDMFQGIEDNGTVKDMIEFIDEFGNEEMLSRYGIRSAAQVKKLAKTIMGESITESYKGNFTDFKYDLEMAIDNMDISPKAIKSVKKKGNGYEVRLSSYMSDKSTWEKIADTIGATLISFKPGSINIGIYE